MNSFSQDQERKIKHLDKLFAALTVEELEELTGAPVVVAKLKGQDFLTMGPLSQLLMEHNTMWNDYWNAKASNDMIRQDFSTLLKILSKGMGDYTAASDFTNLKGKYGVY